MSDVILKGAKLGRDIAVQISKTLHENSLTFDEKLDLLEEIADYCEGKIQETWDEKLDYDDEVEV